MCLLFELSYGKTALLEYTAVQRAELTQTMTTPPIDSNVSL